MIEFHHYFLLKNQKPYRFEFVSGHTCVFMTLNATDRDDFKWDAELLQLAALKNENKRVIIKLNLELETGFSCSSEMDFSRYMLAIEELNKKIIALFYDIIDGVVFYDGSVALEHLCQLTKAEIDDNIHPNLKKIYEVQMQHRFAAAAIFGSLLHSLSSFVDDRIACFVLFHDAEIFDPIDIAVFFSKERFEHVLIACHNKHFQYTTLDLGCGMSSIGYISNQIQALNPVIKLALLLPSDANLSLKAYESLKAIMQNHSCYRMIGELIFNECWNDIDEVVYDSSTLHAMTLRMIKGFEASGGIAFNQQA